MPYNKVYDVISMFSHNEHVKYYEISPHILPETPTPLPPTRNLNMLYNKETTCILEYGTK